jgi:hypothetical protein
MVVVLVVKTGIVPLGWLSATPIDVMVKNSNVIFVIQKEHVMSEKRMWEK